MFEDSTFESMGKIRTRSRGWMIATLAFNSSILLALILIPLICPEALPRQAIAFLMDAPEPPAQTQPVTQRARTVAVPLENPFQAPRRIPNTTYVPAKPEPPISDAAWDPDADGPGNPDNLFPGQGRVAVVHPAARSSVRVSGAVEDGLLLRKTMPAYPLMAKEMRVQGTVVLAATISKSGTIKNLRAVSGPSVLRQAALDAVRSWSYRPYLLDGQPVDVETSINVVFTLD